MTNKSISQLNAGVAVASTDLFPDVQTVGVGPVKVTAAQIGEYVLSGSGLTGTLPVSRGGTGLNSLTAGYIPFGNGTSAFGSSANIIWNNSTNNLTVSGNASILSVIANTATGQTPAAGGRILLDGSNNNNWIDIFSNTTGAGGIRFGDSGSSQKGRLGYNNSNNYMDFWANGSEAMRITSTGRVGIGTSTPGTSLQLTTADQSTCRLRLENTGTSGRTWDIVSGNPGVSNINFSIYDVTASATRLSIDSSGNVGIGTSAPQGKLQINNISSGTITVGAILLNNSATSAGTGIDLRFYVNDGDADRCATIRATQPVAGNTSDLRFITSNYDTPTERMIITQTGNVGIGTSSLTGMSLKIGKNLTGATTASQVSAEYTISSDVTSNAQSYVSSITTAAATFGLNNLYHYRTYQGTLGAGSSVTNQYGFQADASLTGATNNYGFYSNIASGTGRWNFYANGTADNYFAGNVGIGTSSPTNKLHILSNSGASSAGARIEYTGSTQYSGAYLQLKTNISTTNQQQVWLINSITDASNTYGQFSIGQFTSTGGFVQTLCAYEMNGNNWNFYTNNTERLRIDSSGNVGIGTSSPADKFEVRGNGIFSQTSNDAYSNSLTISKSRSSSIVQNGDEIGSVRFNGYDGTNYIRAAQIYAFVDGTPGTNDMPGRLVMYTTADGASSSTERMRIDASGNVVINTAAIATNATDGFLYVPTCAGTPTGTPTTYTGRAPIVVNSTNNKLYFYSGGAWRDAGP